MRAWYIVSLLVVVVSGRMMAEVPAIERVVTMLENLILMLDSEGAEDEKKVAHFEQYCEAEKASANNKISEAQTKIENTNAALVDLGSQKQELDSKVAKLKAQIDTETSQVNAATDKRQTEKDAFNKEQIDFDNAINACDKAVTLLGAHYGDGSVKEARKPGFLSLLTSIESAAAKLGRKAHQAKALKMLQVHFSQPNNDVYQDSSGDAGNIVDQVKMLSETFAEDKASAIDEEGRLQKSFDNLISKKKELLSSLSWEKDSEQATLNQVNQNIAEQQSALSMAQSLLTDQQQYLSTVTKQLDEAKEMFAIRKKDRGDEKAAVNKGLAALEKASFFVQTEKDVRGTTISFAVRTRKSLPVCKNCGKAAAMLRQKAYLFHSAVLSAASATTMGSDAIDDVINNLKDLLTRVAQEQQTEKEHKEWCEQETGLSKSKRDDHSSIVNDLKGVIADLKEVINEKKIALDENQDSIWDETDNFEKQTELRTEGKNEFEEDLQDHMDAIQALNEAIEILANFYAKRKGFVQESTAAQRPISKAFLQRGPDGAKTVGVMSKIRKEFEDSKKHIEEDEHEQVEDFEEVKKIHRKTDADLNSDHNTITVEEQTASAQLDSASQDKLNNEGEVAAAEQYLQQLGKSCYPLMMHFDERTKLRKEEKAAIKDAIQVLREA